MRHKYTIICTTKQNDLLSSDANTLAVGNTLKLTNIPKYPTKKLNQLIQNVNSGRIFIISPFADSLPNNTLMKIDNIDGDIIKYDQYNGCKEAKEKITDSKTSIIIDKESFREVVDMSGQGDYLFYINELISSANTEYEIIRKRRAGVPVNVLVKVDKDKKPEQLENNDKEYVYKRIAGRLVKVEKEVHEKRVLDKKTHKKQPVKEIVQTQKRVAGKLVTINDASTVDTVSTFMPRYVRPTTVFFILGTKELCIKCISDPLFNMIKATHTKTVLISDEDGFDDQFSERIEYPPNVKKSEHISKQDKKKIEKYCDNLFVINDSLYIYPDTPWLDILPKKRLICVIPIHKRETITIETVKMLRRQSYPFYKIILVGDTDVEQKIAEQADCHFVKHPNRPLARKFQAGIDEARKFNPDAIVISGSDDWLSYKWNETYLKYIDDFDVIGNKTWLTLQVLNNEDIKLVKGTYNNNRIDPIGAGRTISRRILDKMNWQIYDFNKESSLDSHSFNKMKNMNAKIKLLEDPNAVICSIKSTWKCIDPFNNNVKSSNYVHGYQNEFNILFPGADDSLDILADSYRWI